MNNKRKFQRGQDYTITTKIVSQIAFYEGPGPEGKISIKPIVDGITGRGLRAVVDAAQPTKHFEIRASDGTLIMQGFDFPGAEHDLDKLAEFKLEKHLADKVVAAQAKQAQKAAEAQRKAALERFTAAERHPADDDFVFGSDQAVWATPNRLIAKKAFQLRPFAFVGVSLDHSGHRYWVFEDAQNELADSLCPSCGNDDILDIPDSSTGIVSRVCHAHSCSFRWAKEMPQRCPQCGHKELSVIADGGDVYVSCNNRANCTYEARLGHLPVIPDSEHTAELLAPGVAGLEE